MDRSKIQLSAEEIKLVNNSEWILTKQAIIQKVCLMLGDLSEQIQQEWQQLALPIDSPSPKLSKGELYESLPWVVLDYPRIFSKQDVLAVRCFFWWAHYFSITLHLKGKYQAMFQQNLFVPNEGEWFVSSAGDEFCFNLSSADYDACAREWRGVKGNNEKQPFIKLSMRIPLEEWERVPAIMLNVFRSWTGGLLNQRN